MSCGLRQTWEQVRSDLVLPGADPNCYLRSLCLGLYARNWRRAATSPRLRRTLSAKLRDLLGLADGQRLHPVSFAGRPGQELGLLVLRHRVRSRLLSWSAHLEPPPGLAEVCGPEPGWKLHCYAGPTLITIIFKRIIFIKSLLLLLLLLLLLIYTSLEGSWSSWLGLYAGQRRHGVLPIRFRHGEDLARSLDGASFALSLCSQHDGLGGRRFSHREVPEYPGLSEPDLL